jgi:hypothetical protein
MQGLIRLFLLTGLTFLVTACYGPTTQVTPEEDVEIAQIEQTLEDSIKNETGRN